MSSSTAYLFLTALLVRVKILLLGDPVAWVICAVCLYFGFKARRWYLPLLLGAGAGAFNGILLFETWKMFGFAKEWPERFATLMLVHATAYVFAYCAGLAAGYLLRVVQRNRPASPGA